MKYFSFFIFLLLVPAGWMFSGCGGANAGGEAIHFADISLADALSESRETHKPVFLNAYASWCGYCKKMQRNVYTDPGVKAYMEEHFINLSIDMEKGEGPELARKYGVAVYPTFLILDEDGSLIKSNGGYLTVNEFLIFVKHLN